MCTRQALKLLALTGVVSFVLYMAVQNRCLCPACHDGERASAIQTWPVAGGALSTTSAIDAGEGFSEAGSGGAE